MWTCCGRGRGHGHGYRGGGSSAQAHTVNQTQTVGIGETDGGDYIDYMKQGTLFAANTEN